MTSVDNFFGFSLFNCNANVFCKKHFDLRSFDKTTPYRRTLRFEIFFGNWKPFKNDEKCFLFHL